MKPLTLLFAVLFLPLLMPAQVLQCPDTLTHSYSQYEGGHCAADCKFCRSVETADWVDLERRIARMARMLDGVPNGMDSLKKQLETHRNISFVRTMPPDQSLKKPMGIMAIGFRQTWCTIMREIHLKQAPKDKEARIRLRYFGWAEYYERAETEEYLRFYRLVNPSEKINHSNVYPVVNDYFHKWSLNKDLHSLKYRQFEEKLLSSPMEVTDSLDKAGDGIGLCMMTGHYDLKVRLRAIQALVNQTDPGILNYLIILGACIQYETIENNEYTSDRLNFYEALIKNLEMRSGCTFYRSPYEHWPPQTLLKKGLDYWQVRFPMKHMICEEGVAL